MRVLFVSHAGIGHLFPMVPLAWALRATGHEVLVATAGESVEPARHAGLTAVNVAPDVDRDAMLATMFAQQPDRVRERLSRRLDDLKTVAHWFSRTSEQVVDGVVALADAWRPDVIVQSQLQGAGLVAAGRLGIPVVDHGFGFARTDGFAELHRQHMAAAFDRHNAELPQWRATIDVAPPSTVAPYGWPMRYVPYNGGTTLPDWLLESPPRTRIAVTFGTVAVQTLGVDPLRAIIGLAPDVPADFVLALGDVDLTELGPLPDNVHAPGWVPLNVLLPTCAAVVHHGGAGTALTALACGVPQLVLPTGADRHINGEAVAGRGAGLVAQTLTAEGVHALIEDIELRAAAADVAAEMANLPSPAEVATRLTGFVAHPRQSVAYPPS